MCTEESATFNLTEVATEKLTTEIDDFFANFDRETMLEEKLAKFQEPRNTITINSKECLISFDEYETCAEIRSKNTSNIIFDGKNLLKRVLELCELSKVTEHCY